jgi:phage terminase large subunit-like protein
MATSYSTLPKPFVFVLMPFDKKFNDVYQLGIKKACDEAGAYAERIDEQIFKESILNRIYNQIAKADVIISDMTGRNPNVFYETGYAHALGKNVILLTQNADDIPFDLKHYPHIIYGGVITELIPQLEKRVKWAIEHAQREEFQPKPPVEFYSQGISLAENPTLPIKKETNQFRLHFDCHNTDDRTIQTVRFQVVFVTSEFLSRSFDSGEPINVIRLPKGGCIHTPFDTFSLYPGGWESLCIMFRTQDGKKFTTGDIETITLRMLSEDGGRDYPFKIECKPPQDKAD